MDLTFCTGNETFNYRACAVICSGQQILAMQDERSPYYYLPGGRVQMGETAEQAVARELREELGLALPVQRPLWLNQAFFTEDVSGQNYHELCVYFLVDGEDAALQQRGERFTTREGGRTHTFVWLPFARLQQEYFYPQFLKTEIFRLPEQFILRTEDERLPAAGQ